jgi:hypothetical protein
MTGSPMPSPGGRRLGTWWRHLSKIKKVGFSTTISVAGLVVAIVALYPAFGSYWIDRAAVVAPRQSATASLPGPLISSATPTPSVAATPTTTETSGPVSVPTGPSIRRSAGPSTGGGYSGSPVTLSAKHSGDRAVAVTVTTHRAPDGDARFWLMLEVHNVSGTHSEFYPRQRLEKQPQVSRFTLSIPGDADLSRTRTARVVEVPATTDRLYLSGHPDPANADADFVLLSPCCAVSAEVTLPFG